MCNKLRNWRKFRPWLRKGRSQGNVVYFDLQNKGIAGGGGRDKAKLTWANLAKIKVGKIRFSRPRMNAPSIPS